MSSSITISRNMVKTNWIKGAKYKQDVFNKTFKHSISITINCVCNFQYILQNMGFKGPKSLAFLGGHMIALVSASLTLIHLGPL